MLLAAEGLGFDPAEKERLQQIRPPALNGSSKTNRSAP
jgi:hypothetical protein